MSELKTWIVKRVTRKLITRFIEKWHYSGSINGCISDYCYALFDNQGVIKDALETGEAKYVKTIGKVTYVYRLKKPRKQINDLSKYFS